MNMLFLLLSCVFSYGEPIVSHIPTPSNQKGIDFSPLHAQIDALLIKEKDRGRLVQLQELEHLLIKAKTWNLAAQQDIFVFAENFLAQYDSTDENLKPEEPILQMKDSFDVVVLDDQIVEEQSEYLQKAQQLVSEGKITEAIQFLEECREQPCWSAVYVFWAECVDKVFAEKKSFILSQELPPQEELLLWEKMEQDYSHPQHLKTIAAEKKRLRAMLERAQ